MQFTWTANVEGVLGFGQSISHIFTTPGPRVIKLTVKDDEGLKVERVSNITVAENTKSALTIKKPFPSQQLVKGATYAFESASYDPDEPGDTLPCGSLHWTAQKSTGISVQIPLGTGCTLPAKFTGLGSYIVKLFGTDSQGATGSAQALVDVAEVLASGKPIVQIVYPNDNDVLLVDEEYILHGSATDPNYTTPLQYSWELVFEGTTLILESGWATNGQPLKLHWTPTSQQLQKSCKTFGATLKLRVIDPDGEKGIALRDIRINFGPC